MTQGSILKAFGLLMEWVKGPNVCSDTNSVTVPHVSQLNPGI